MSEVLYERLKENLEALKMRNTLEILDNYLERAIKDELNIVDVLDHIFAGEARSKRQRAYEKQIQMSGFPIKKTLEDFDFSFQPSIDKRQIDELATMRFVENAENIVFLISPTPWAWWPPKTAIPPTISTAIPSLNSSKRATTRTACQKS